MAFLAVPLAAVGGAVGGGAVVGGMIVGAVAGGAYAASRGDNIFQGILKGAAIGGTVGFGAGALAPQTITPSAGFSKLAAGKAAAGSTGQSAALSTSGALAGGGTAASTAAPLATSDKLLLTSGGLQAVSGVGQAIEEKKTREAGEEALNAQLERQRLGAIAPRARLQQPTATLELYKTPTTQATGDQLAQVTEGATGGILDRPTQQTTTTAQLTR